MARVDTLARRAHHRFVVTQQHHDLGPALSRATVAARVRARGLALALACASLGMSGCGPSKPLGEKAERLDKPQTKVDEARAISLALVRDGGDVRFSMDAPVEKIRGEIDRTKVTASLDIDPSAISNSTGLVSADLSTLVLYYRKDEDGDGTFDDEVRSDKQNAHARAWLEIDDAAPEDEREKNRYVAFSLLRVEDPSAEDVGALAGDARVVTFTAVGEFLLHQRKVEKRVSMEATFHYEAGALTRIDVRTAAPFPVDLAEHGVAPREAFGVLAQKTLSALSDKVAQVADVEIALSFVVQPKKDDA